MVQGQSSVVSDVTHLIREENVIKNACDELAVLFDICRSFGGDDVIDYPRRKASPLPADRDQPKRVVPPVLGTG